MRRTAILSLTAILALTSVGFLGSSSAAASSTALCRVDESPFAIGNRVTHIHEVDPQILLLNSITGYIECVGLFLGDTLATQSGLGSPLHILGSYLFSNCFDEVGRSCIVSELSSPALSTLLRIGIETALWTSELELLFECGEFIHCDYNGVGLNGVGEGALLSGGTGLYRTHEATFNKVLGFLCPSTIKLDALYEPLSATYISL